MYNGYHVMSAGWDPSGLDYWDDFWDGWEEVKDYWSGERGGDFIDDLSGGAREPEGRLAIKIGSYATMNPWIIKGTGFVVDVGLDDEDTPGPDDIPVPPPGIKPNKDGSDKSPGQDFEELTETQRKRGHSHIEYLDRARQRDIKNLEDVNDVGIPKPLPPSDNDEE